MANIVIREASAADLASLQTLNEQVQTLHFIARPDQFKPVQPPVIASFLRELLQKPEVRVWVAELDGSVVGYAVVERYERPEGPFCPARAWWCIEQIGVAPEQRRQGVGRALVEQVIGAAHAAGIAQIELNSWSFNDAAHATFRSLGFAPKSVRFELSVGPARPEDDT